MIAFGLEPEPLAYRVRPLADECFDSWFDRVALAHEATRSVLFRHLGIEPVLAGQDLARGRRGLDAAWYAAFDGLVERLAWAVQCEKERISATFLACEASALLPRGLRHYACARCWYEARRAGKPEFIRREWILRASWRCREHGLPLSDMGKVPGESGGRLSLAQLARLVIVAERSLAVARPSQKTIRRNSAALAQLARQSEWQRGRAIDLAYRDRFAANAFHFSADRTAMLALAHGRRDPAARRFETLISQALPERPTPVWRDKARDTHSSALIKRHNVVFSMNFSSAPTKVIFPWVPKQPTLRLSIAKLESSFARTKTAKDSQALRSGFEGRCRALFRVSQVRAA